MGFLFIKLEDLQYLCQIVSLIIHKEH
jgi:hypothetical protein